MPLYDVMFDGVQHRVEAANPEDAWSAYCTANPSAIKHPNSAKRFITEVSVPRQVVEEQRPVPLPEPDKPSPVHRRGSHA